MIMITKKQGGSVHGVVASCARRAHPHGGFTLVETLVAITIIAIAMTGPFFAVQQALNASRTARDQLIASSLAQEGIEYVRAVRDTNYLSGRSWLAGFDGTAGELSASANCFTADCVVDPAKRTARTTITPLYISESGTNALYNQQQAGMQTPFTRKVRIANVSGRPHEAVVTVTVTWTSRGQTQTVTVRETLNNWL